MGGVLRGGIFGGVVFNGGGCCGAGFWGAGFLGVDEGEEVGGAGAAGVDLVGLGEPAQVGGGVDLDDAGLAAVTLDDLGEGGVDEALAGERERGLVGLEGVEVGLAFIVGDRDGAASEAGGPVIPGAAVVPAEQGEEALGVIVGA